MALVLHSYRRCPFAIRVRMVLEEKGIPYTVLEESLRVPSAELLRVNPSGKVPVLIHDGEAIPESAVITSYLEKKFPAPALVPPGKIAFVEEWTLWCDQQLKPDLDLFKYKWKELEEAARANLRARLNGHLQKLEHALEKNEFLLGDQLTLADIHVFPFFRQLSKCDGFAEHFPFVEKAQKWLLRVMGRDSFVRVMRKPSL